MNTLEFEIHNQTLVRIDSQDVINKNKNVYKCIFTFDEDSEWINLNKFVLFTDGWGNSKTQHLGNNSNCLSCLVPDKMLSGSYFKISVYAGDLITTNNVSVNLIQSGYNRHNHNTCECDCHRHTNKDIFVEIFDRLDNTVDSIVYDNKTLHLFCRDTLLESIYIPLLEENEIRDLVTNLTKDFINNIPIANADGDGLLSSEDKVKLDSIESGANKTIIDSELDENSDNPVSNKVITSMMNNHNTDITDLQERQDNTSIKLNNLQEDYDYNKDVINNHMNKIVDDINDLNTTLESKEDRYDYVERLDNIIVELITKGE